MLAYPSVIIVFLPFCLAEKQIQRSNMPPANYKVTVAFFSGRNDPEWTVSSNDTLTQLLRDATSKGFAYTPEDMPARIGYRGMLVEELRTKKETLIVGPETKKLQQLLLSTMPGDLMKSGDLVEIESDIRLGEIKAVKPPIYKVRGKRYAPPYDPENWQVFEPINRRILCNNCYNYANRIATDNRAQPGYGGGQQYTQYTAPDLIAAAERDGLTQLNPHPDDNQPVPGPPNDMSKHLVALVIRPDSSTRSGDHHWYRLDNNGLWSHKPGQGLVTQLDKVNVPIVDPRKAKSGYYVFKRFMVSNRQTISISSAWICPYT